MILSSKQDLLDARARISHIVHRTPVLTSSTLNEMTGAEVFIRKFCAGYCACRKDQRSKSSDCHAGECTRSES